MLFTLSILSFDHPLKVPNYRTGKMCTYDRTEPMLGSWALQVIHDVFGNQTSWVVELLYVLYSSPFV
jgi:hypothetical protein